MKVDEINTNLTEEITPRLDELRGQKTHYLKWKANDGEENRLQKFCVAYSYNQAETTLNSSEEGKKELCLLYTSPSPRDATLSRMPSSA